VTRTKSQTLRTLVPRPSGMRPAVEPPKVPDSGGAIRRWLRGALVDNLGLKFLSMVLAVTVFLLVTTDRDREITLKLNVDYEYNRAEKVLVSEPLKDVSVTLKGPGRRLRELDERELGIVILKTQGMTGELSIGPSAIPNLPPGISVTSISPRTVRVAFDTIVEKVVEVSPTTIGRPQHGYVVKEVTPAPATTKVRGGQRVLAALTTIKTADVSVEGLTATTEVLVGLAPPDGVTGDPTQRFAVTVRIEEELVTRKLPAVAVVPSDNADPARWTFNPSEVEVTLTGSLLAVDAVKERLTMGTLTPVVKVPASGKTEVKIHGLPAGVGIKLSPEFVDVKPAAAPKPPPP
jgi:YbbR domain-containing protein